MSQNGYELISCGIHNCTPEWEWNSKGFDDYDLWAVFAGEGCLVLNNIEHKVTAGTCVLIPPNTAIHGTHNKAKCLVVYNVHFKLTNSKNENITNSSEVRQITDISFFKNLFERMVSFGNMSRSDLSNACIELLLNEFFSSPKADGEIRTPAETAHIRCILEICAKKNGSPEACISLSDLAAEYGYSPAYLGKLFHKIAGVPFSDYLANARINRAKILLTSTEFSIAEIAHKLGYYDPCHFVKQFKKLVGRTPKAFR